MNQTEGYEISRALLVVGGIVAIVLGGTQLAAIGLLNFANAARDLTLFYPVMAIVVGAIALMSANHIKDESWSIVVAVLGFIAGGVGGIIVAIAAIFAIASRHALKSPTT